MARFIFITGGVTSSLGKGIASSCLGTLLQAQGYSVRNRKLDPYLNVDPGILSPFQHGEVYVTDDGAETDLDLGHYERFTGVALHKSDTTTSGQIYASVIAKEKRGEFNGRTIQIIPHITNAVKEFVTSDIEGEDFVICEIGGTVGDIESQSFIEAIRQLENELPIKPMFIHLTLLPFIASAGELKTKPTQQSVRELLSMGIQADLLLCRSEIPFSDEEKKKIALFCNVGEDDVIQNLDVPSLYELPLALHKAGLDRQVLHFFGLEGKKLPDLSKWETAVERYKNPKHEINIAVVGKYVSMIETYESLREAIIHGGVANECKINVDWVDAEDIEKKGANKFLHGKDGIIIPTGFGERGSKGKAAASLYARENKIPLLAMGLGMQMALVDIAANVAKIKGAGSAEFGDNENQIVVPLTAIAPDAMYCEIKDDNIRLGARFINFTDGSQIAAIYGKDSAFERHRHRYGINPEYKEALEKVGVTFSGFSEDGGLIESFELAGHPYFIGVLYQPEFKSKVFEPHPLFVSFTEAAIEKKEGVF